MCRSLFPRLMLCRRLYNLRLKAFLFGSVISALVSVFGVHLSPALAATLPSGFTESLIASGMTAPTAMAFAPDGRLFVCQQAGQLRVIKNGTLLPTPFLTVTTTNAGERGLFGVAFDPNFGTNGFI